MAGLDCVRCRRTNVIEIYKHRQFKATTEVQNDHETNREQSDECIVYDSLPNMGASAYSALRVAMSQAYSKDSQHVVSQSNTCWLRADGHLPANGNSRHTSQYTRYEGLPPGGFDCKSQIEVKRLYLTIKPSASSTSSGTVCRRAWQMPCTFILR